MTTQQPELELVQPSERKAPPWYTEVEAAEVIADDDLVLAVRDALEERTAQLLVDDESRRTYLLEYIDPQGKKTQRSIQGDTPLFALIVDAFCSRSLAIEDAGKNGSVTTEKAKLTEQKKIFFTLIRADQPDNHIVFRTEGLTTAVYRFKFDSAAKRKQVEHLLVLYLCFNSDEAGDQVSVMGIISRLFNWGAEFLGTE